MYELELPLNILEVPFFAVPCVNSPFFPSTTNIQDPGGILRAEYVYEHTRNSVRN